MTFNKDKIKSILQNEKLTIEETSELIWFLDSHLYKEKPVCINEFLDNSLFVKDKWPNIFPLWRNTLNEIYPSPFIAPYNEVIISAAAGAGKAQPLSSELLTPQGWIRMKEAQIGQQLFDGNGEICSITGIYPQGIRECYKIKFNDGTCIEVSDEHINSVLINNKEYNITTLKLKDLIEDNNVYVSVPVLNWAEIKSDAYETGVSIIKEQKDTIPEEYLFTSISTRIQLLCGIMDTVKEINTFKTEKTQLSKDFEFLIRSLGGVDYIQELIDVYPQSQKLQVDKRFYTHKFKINRIPISSEYIKTTAKKLLRKIEAVKKIKSKPCQCIMVDSPAHTYITNHVTPTHNTVTATIGTLYDMYKLGCLKDPCSFYKLSPGTMLIFAVFSATGSTAAVNWQDITTGIEMCPWISKQVVDKRGLEKKYGSLVPVEILPGIFIQTGSRFQHSMGKAIFSGLMDEAAFGGDNLTIAQKTYNELSSRMKTRFRTYSKKGNIPGHLFLISSPKESSDFMQYRIETATASGSKQILIKKNISSWEANPSNDSDEKFTVFVGNEFKEPKIYEENESPSIEDIDYLIYPPISYIDDFKQDLIGAIMNYGGITTISDIGVFKSPSLLSECTVLNNPFNNGVIKLPFSKYEKQLMDFIDLDYFKNIRHPEANRFIHIDIAFSSNTMDRYGIAAGYCTLNDRTVFKDLTKGKSSLAEVYEKSERTYYVDWAIGIEPYPQQEIPLSKVKDFILYLIKNLSYPVISISADTFQSKQTLQEFEQLNYDTQSISLDRTRDPYLFLRQLVTNKQILLPKNEYLRTELINLRDTGKKIDHRINGSKDISDAVAGCIWNCANSNKIFNLSKITQAVLNPFTPLNTTMSEEEKKTVELLEFERIKASYSNGLFKNL